jgi:hypothetical protein
MKSFSTASEASLLIALPVTAFSEGGYRWGKKSILKNRALCIKCIQIKWRLITRKNKEAVLEIRGLISL